MQYIFNVVTGRIVVSTLAAFLLKNENQYIEVDLNNPNETNQAAEARAVELGVELTKKPVDVWLEYIDYINTLTVINGDPLYNYIKSARMDLPTVIELAHPCQEQSTVVAENTTTVAVIECPAVLNEGTSQAVAEQNDCVVSPASEPQVAESLSTDTDNMVQVAMAGHRSYEEVLTTLAKNGYFVDTVEGEVEKVSKDLYGFQHDGSFIVLSPKVITSDSEDFVFLQSIKVLQHFPADGASVCIPTYGDMYGIACGTPTPTVLTEDVVNLHNKLIQTVGYNGKGSLVSRIEPDGKEVIMAGYLVSLTQPQ